MADNVWVIGDIHGYSLAFERLLENISPSADDTIVTLGDYIDRGPDSRGVVQRLMRLGSECRLVPLLGNHEDLMFQTLPPDFCRANTLGVWYIEDQVFDPNFLKRWMNKAFKKDGQKALKKNWYQLGGLQTLTSYGSRGNGAEDIPLEHLRFLAQCPLYYETETAIFMHAGYAPHLELRRQPRSMLLQMRLSHGIPQPHQSGKRAFVGHSAQRSGEILDHGHILCLDTCLYGGGLLTAMEIHSGQILQIDSGGRLKKGQWRPLSQPENTPDS